MSPQELGQVLDQLPVFNDPNVLVGTETADDVGVYLMENGQALLLTVDFFTPVVDDPFTFGAIAAANSLSDIYAKGVKPLVALNLIGFPSKKLPLDIMVDILKGGAEKAREASIPIIGGHTIDDPEPKYGLSLVAVSETDEVMTNAGAEPGDALVLTKPLGTGIITTAIKFEKASEELTAEAAAIMATLNKNASEAMVETGVNSCTDVTGFGLLGHLHEMTSASSLGARVYASQVPLINGAKELALDGVAPGGAYNNMNHLENKVAWDDSLPEVDRLILCDPQTSGGLLIALPADKKDLLLETLDKRGVQGAFIGEIIEEPGIEVSP